MIYDGNWKDVKIGNGYYNNMINIIGFFWWINSFNFFYLYFDGFKL